MPAVSIQYVTGSVPTSSPTATVHGEVYNEDGLYCLLTVEDVPLGHRFIGVVKSSVRAQWEDIPDEPRNEYGVWTPAFNEGTIHGSGSENVTFRFFLAPPGASVVGEVTIAVASV